MNEIPDFSNHVVLSNSNYQAGDLIFSAYGDLYRVQNNVDGFSTLIRVETASGNTVTNPWVLQATTASVVWGDLPNEFQPVPVAISEPIKKKTIFDLITLTKENDEHKEGHS